MLIKVTQYIITDDKNVALRFRFFDSQGLEANEQGISMEDIIQVMDGKVKKCIAIFDFDLA
jgi:hypothetical protein